MAVTSEAVRGALTRKYIKESREPNVDQDQLIEFLRSITPDKIDNELRLTKLIESEHPDWVLADSDQAIVQSVDDITRALTKSIDLDDGIDHQVFGTLPELTVQILKNPSIGADVPKNSIFTVLDGLITACVGWTPELGRAGDQLMKQVNDAVGLIRAAETDYGKVNDELTSFLEKEQKRIQKLEERLIASETGILRTKNGKKAAAEFLNEAMNDKQLTESMVSFLQGFWFESLQLHAISKGLDSEEWSRASKVTETLIWTVQPIEEENDQKVQVEKQKLYRIIEHLPGEIKDLLISVSDADQSASAIEDIENEHMMIVSGQELEYVEFELLDIGNDSGIAAPSVSKSLLKKVNELKPGQWFTFEEGDVSVRIKLILKLPDIKQMLFTNRNGMKALEKSFDDMAYYMSSGVVKPLNSEAAFSSTFSKYYTGLATEYERKQKLAAEEREEEERREAAVAAAQQKAEEEAKALAVTKAEEEKLRKEEERKERMERVKAMAEEQKDKIPEVTAIVDKLNTGAWVKLTGADGVMEDCKLAVKLAASDKMIFVNSSGVKVGEHTTEQLVQLIIAGEADVADGGVKYEDTLAQVVTRLRQDRNKSYDDLTGSSD